MVKFNNIIGYARRLGKDHGRLEEILDGLEGDAVGAVAFVDMETGWDREMEAFIDVALAVGHQSEALNAAARMSFFIFAKRRQPQPYIREFGIFKPAIYDDSGLVEICTADKLHSVLGESKDERSRKEHERKEAQLRHRFKHLEDELDKQYAKKEQGLRNWYEERYYDLQIDFFLLLKAKYDALIEPVKRLIISCAGRLDNICDFVKEQVKLEPEDVNPDYVERLANLVERLGSENGPRDLEEAIECAGIELPSVVVLRRISNDSEGNRQGIFKIVYLAESVVSPGFYRVVKKLEPSERGKDVLERKGLTLEEWKKVEAYVTKLSEINHPNVVRVELPQVAGSNVYLIEEYFEMTLKDYLKDKGPLSISESLSILRQIAEGLQAAHEHGVVHRDLKFDNIGISKGVIKLTDFGGFESQVLDKTVRHECTLDTVPPELFTEGNLGVEYNSWAMGCFAYQLLLGRPPFTPRTEDGKLMDKREDRAVYNTKVKEMVLSGDYRNIYMDLNLEFQRRFVGALSEYINSNHPDSSYHIHLMEIEDCFKYLTSNLTLDKKERQPMSKIITVIKEAEEHLEKLVSYYLKEGDRNRFNL